MSSDINVVIDDLTIGRVQRTLLQRDLQPSSDQGPRLRWLSEMQIDVPASWQDVAAEPRRRLAARLAAVAGDLGDRPLVWLDGAVVFDGDPGDPLGDEAVPLRALAGRLGLQTVMAINPSAGDAEAMRDRARRLRDETFHVAADAVLEAAPLPAGWRALPYRHPDRGAVIDCRLFHSRPWYCATAPAAAVWEAKLMAALDRGEIDRSDLEADVATGLIRSSILFQVDHDGMAAASLPRTLLDLDAATPVAEARPSAQQVEMITTVRFALPRKRSEPDRPRYRTLKEIADTAAWKAMPARGIFRYGPLARRNIKSYRGLVLWASEICRNVARNPRWLVSRLRSVGSRVIRR